MKQVYDEFGLKGNVVALGGNLWNQYVRESLLAPDGKDELGCAARAFFDKILPELDNFVEQKISHEKRTLELQVDELREVLASVTVGFCRFCNCGGDAKLQNHRPECEVAHLLGITEKRVDPPRKCDRCGREGSSVIRAVIGNPAEYLCHKCDRL